MENYDKGDNLSQQVVKGEKMRQWGDGVKQFFIFYILFRDKILFISVY